MTQGINLHKTSSLVYEGDLVGTLPFHVIWPIGIGTSVGGQPLTSRTAQSGDGDEDDVEEERTESRAGGERSNFHAVYMIPYLKHNVKLVPHPS